MNKQNWADTIARWRVPASFVMALIYFLWARPTWQSLGEGAALAALGLVWRAWASGTIRKDSTLAMSGPYAFSRNPLYFGSFLIVLGFGWAGDRRLLLILLIVFFLILYVPVMKLEENHLERLFGVRFHDYRKKIPLFLPWKRVRAHDSPAAAFNWGQYWGNREYNVLLGFGAAVGLLLLIKYWRGMQ
ncbi:MAG: methyltransferase [Acidobacteriia bacterium]|nr:methyltransferase [Terriglobia bacterium]